MANKKFYAVRIGRSPGIYPTWDECKAQIHGFANASYKKFQTLDEAKAFILQKEAKESTIDEGLHIYIDGSYKVKTGHFSYGLVGFYEGQEFEEYQAYAHEEYKTHRNVSGELFGALRAFSIAKEKGVSYLHLYYDYAGIEKWAIGEWRTNTPLTKMYQQKFQSMKGLHVAFHKIAAHTGHQYNERADKLAKKALEEGEYVERI